MKQVQFYAAGNRSGGVLHIETDGCIVNIHVGLTDAGGRQVTRVDVSPDDQTRGGDGEGRLWYQDGPRIIRLHDGEEPPAAVQPYITATYAEGVDREVFYGPFAGEDAANDYAVASIAADPGDNDTDVTSASVIPLHAPLQFPAV